MTPTPEEPAGANAADANPSDRQPAEAPQAEAPAKAPADAPQADEPQQDSALELFPGAAGQRILCVVAHPDDLEYGTSCAVAQWTDAGAHVSYLLLTAGEAGIQSKDPAQTGPVRRAEQQRACEIVGVNDLRILDFPDGVLETSLAVRKAIAAVIREIRPDVVVTMDWSVEMPWGLNQADHRAAGLCTVDAIRDAGNPWVFPELVADAGLQPWSVGALLVFGSASPSHVVEVTETALERGIKSLEAHELYLAELPGHPEPGKFLAENTQQAAQASGLDMRNAVAFRRYDM